MEAKTWTGRKILSYGAIAGALMAISGAATQIHNWWPDYATAAELEDVRVILAGGQVKLTAEVITIQQRANTAANHRNEAEIARANRRGEDDPNYIIPRELLDARIFYEAEGNRLRREMSGLGE